MKSKIGVLITTFNSATTIEKAIKSVLWCDEILVVDSYSMDDTLEIAKKYDTRIVQHEYMGSSKQLEYGVSLINNEFVLILDSDEEVSENLREEIINIINTGNFNEGGYRIPRQIYFLGKWIEYGGWNNDLQFRLFKKSNVKFIHTHQAHWSIESSGPIQNLKSIIYHYTYENIYDYIGRLNIYSSLDVKTKIEKSKNIKVKWYHFILNPLADFLRMYFSLKGYKDGMQGLILALFSATHKLSTYTKLWEYEYSQKNNLEVPPISYKEIKNFKKNW
jgi:glycosyltransferase involved in cell wall biosynthesis